MENLALHTSRNSDLKDLHISLAHWNRARLGPAAPEPDWRETLEHDYRMRLVEGAWIEDFRAQVADRIAEIPQTVDGFIAWFRGLEKTGPGQHDPLFDWLATEATAEQMDWFLTQEAAGEAGFDDLVALTQVKLPVPAKLELARNYWDEMGRGNEKGMHGPMLERAVETLGLTPTIEGTLWQSLALANTLTAFATTRRYAWHAVGALGVVELTAPGRVSLVGKGLRRLDHPPVVRKYFDLHAVLDVRHAEDWIENALRPSLEEDMGRARSIAEGAVMRLVCGQRCFDAYRQVLWGVQASRDAA